MFMYCSDTRSRVSPRQPIRATGPRSAVRYDRYARFANTLFSSSELKSRPKYRRSRRCVIFKPFLYFGLFVFIAPATHRLVFSSCLYYY